jgi:hypothetical protein
MEAAYIQFFALGRLHNDPSQAVALAVALRLIQLVWALPGILVPLLGAHLPRKDELASLEAQRPDQTQLPPTAGPSTNVDTGSPVAAPAASQK